MATNINPEENIKKSFNLRKTIVNILFYVAVFGAAFAVFALTHRNPTLTGLPYTPEFWIGAVVFFISAVISFYLWRCPKCKKFLGLKLGIIKCKNCRVELRKLDEPNINGDIEDYYIKKYKTYTLKFWLYLILIFIVNGIFLILINKYKITGALIYLLIITLLVPFFIIRYKYRRCPKCGHHFGRNFISDECPKCKTRLKDYDYSS